MVYIHEKNVIYPLFAPFSSFASPCFPLLVYPFLSFSPFFTLFFAALVENMNILTHQPMVFAHILKSSGKQYLKILDFSQLFVADAPMKKKKIQNCSFTPSQTLFVLGRYNRPCIRGLIFFTFVRNLCEQEM